MHPLRRIEEIRSTLVNDAEGAAEIRSALRTLEAGTAVGEILAAVADDKFPAALIEASRESGERERAWLTLAAAGPRRARQVLAWRASQLVDAGELAALTLMRRRSRIGRFAQLASTPGDPASAGAWSLLAHLSCTDLRAMVRARPVLAAALGRARAAAGRRPVPRLDAPLGIAHG